MMENLEASNLSSRACLARNSRGRTRPEEQCFIRTCFQRDSDRILHSESFRRLKHKTQVFLSPTNDHFRTRMTHTLEVVGISRCIARSLRLNENLAEAIALGHDLGHTPFGHAGEQVLSEFSENGFHHSMHGVRVVTALEKNGEGLNLSFEVIDGIAKHSKGRKGAILVSEDDPPVTQEGQIVRISDLVAYINHDIDDAMRAGLIHLKDLPKSAVKLLGDRQSQRIHGMVKDVISNSVDSENISMSPEVLEETENLRSFLYGKVYPRPEIEEEVEKSKKLLRQMGQWFLDNPEDLYKRIKRPIPPNQSFRQTLVDYLASMTDDFAMRVFQELFIPHYSLDATLVKAS
ncbi:deoxyguanosinetriphosphate triphosphohydrolase [bacterium]|nr:deoxyguanosinetriphosphate triphosphohydrolase [bacterium]